MSRISFNKGKKFFGLNKNIETKDKEYILSRLNDKTWSAIVDKMNDDILIDIISNSARFMHGSYTTDSKEHRYIILQVYLDKTNVDLIL